MLKWSLANHKHALHVRRQTIIVTLQSLFEQIKEQKIVQGGLYEPDIPYMDDMWHVYIRFVRQFLVGEYTAATSCCFLLLLVSPARV